MQLLDDMVFWGRRTSDHISGLSEEEFVADTKSCDAVCWCFVCIGEAASRIRQIDPEFVQLNPELHLNSAVAMRHRLAHGYDGLDLFVVWRSAIVSIPALVASIDALLQERASYR
ncbi:HepT-like ribonuclease domain-containing protein [Aquibium carbonis]|uniref:HepT-like ribonuclease domain-containing protein n=1 Tax=Aquibium carbonis TaxID=2495581 RepID=UPI0014785D69|nr:HepT-like ribonuclease domain-containing protein [Aquibium carbonis]